MCDAEKIAEIDELETIAIFGFDGQVKCSLKVHPDNKHLIFPIGNKVSIMNLESNKQDFMCGHTNTISTIDVSKTGDIIASGQVGHMGFRAYVIIWDWKTRNEIGRHEMHKVRVESLCFTCNEEFLISLGGRDDRMIFIWDIKNNVALTGVRAINEVTGEALQVVSLQKRAAVFLTGGDQNLRLWCIQYQTKKVEVHEVLVGKMKREFVGMKVNGSDEFMYAGTMSGDIAKIKLNCHQDAAVVNREKAPVLVGVYGRHIPKKPKGKDCEKYVHGVRDLIILADDRLIVGAGDGTVELVEERNVKFKDYPLPTWPMLKLIKGTKVNGAVSSLQLHGSDTIFIGTEACEIYSWKLTTSSLTLLITCNTSTVYDIVFPHKFSLVFATASYQSVRIWSTSKLQELLRIVVPNFSCASIVFSPDGKTIHSVWSDGVIRAFTPLTGKLIYAIPNAHNKGCSAVTISKCGRILVSGGCEGQVRVWKIEPTRQSLIGVLKEHTSLIGSVHFNKIDTEVVSSCSDGTCIIWDIPRMSRKRVLYANAQFTCAKYFPSGVQILTSGSDRQISYWEVWDASLVRDVEGSVKGPLNCVSLNETGEHFVSVGSDQIVKLWEYQSGTVVSAGYGHAAVIVTCVYSPCGKFVVSGSADGAVIVWKVPKKYWPKKDADPLNIQAKSIERKSSTSVRSKVPENIKELETSRSNKDVHICECPPVDLRCQPDLNEACVGAENATE